MKFLQPSRQAARCLVPLVLIAVSPAKGNVTLPAIFSDHMVLEKSEHVPLWGKADPGEQVRVNLAGRTAEAKADASGRWKLELNLKEAAEGPFSMTVDGKNHLAVQDVVVGEVWLASGQSNMERTVKAMAGAEAEIANSSDSLLRQFRVPKVTAETPADDCKGSWVLSSPETTGGDFTAIGYYFAKRLRADLKAPVGIINASWGGTDCEWWISQDAIDRVESLKTGAEAWRKIAAEYPAQKERFVTEYAAWLKTNRREDHPQDPARFAGEQVSTEGWTPVTLPGKSIGVDLPSGGAVWLRRDIEVPAGAAAQGLNGVLGHIEGFEQVYWNGKRVTDFTYQKYMFQNQGRMFGIAPSLIKPGKNTIALRIYSPARQPAITADAASFKAGPIGLAGAWVAKAEYALPPLDAKAVAAIPKPPARLPGMQASSIFNGVISPIIPYEVAGIIWYQGENNAGRGYEYRKVFSNMITNWREKWHKELPFYFCQLANFQPKKAVPAESEWAELRESQSKALSLPNTEQAVLIDLGEAGDIHPRNKKDVAERLARIAEARQYGRNIAYASPVFDSMAPGENGKLRLKFRHAEGGLAAKPLPARYDVKTIIGETAPLVPNSPGSEVEGFALCGEDHLWQWADAKIDGDTVTVWSDKVPHPVAVRYGWADNPTCNLYNQAGLPATPFRTDEFPVLTEKRHYGF